MSSLFRFIEVCLRYFYIWQMCSYSKRNDVDRIAQVIWSWKNYWWNIDYLSTGCDTDAFWNSWGILKTFPRNISQLNLHLIVIVSKKQLRCCRDLVFLSYGLVLGRLVVHRGITGGFQSHLKLSGTPSPYKSQPHAVSRPQNTRQSQQPSTRMHIDTPVPQVITNYSRKDLFVWATAEVSAPS